MATATEKRVNEHSKQIAIIQEQQIEYYRLLKSINEKLSPDFFGKVEAMYEYVITGNGVTSLKTWRNEIDRERQDFKENRTDALTERRKWFYGVTMFSAGAVVNALFNFIK